MENSAAAPPWAQHPGPQQTPADQQQRQQQAGPYAALYGRPRQPVPANERGSHEQQPVVPAADAQQSHWGQGWQADRSQAQGQLHQTAWADDGQLWPQQVRAQIATPQCEARIRQLRLQDVSCSDSTDVLWVIAGCIRMAGWCCAAASSISAVAAAAASLS